MRSRSSLMVLPPRCAQTFASFTLVLIGAVLSAQESGPAGKASGDAPPWGRLSRIPIFLEVSRNLLDSLPIPSPQTRWSIPESESARVPGVFLDAGLSPKEVEEVTTPAKVVRADGWIHHFPTDALVESMAPEVRAKLYAELGRHEINEFQESPVLILTDTVEEWYQRSLLKPEIVQQLSRLAYRRGNLWAFSDVSLLVSKAKDEGEVREIFKNLTRTRTYLVRIAVGPETQAETIKSYWRRTGTGFRRKDIEPIIESLKETGSEVQLDLAHLLPPMVRKYLYTYPGPEDAAQGILPDCHWTSLNYFNYDPHGYLLDSALATTKVLEDYEEATTPYEYGDILFFLDDETGDAFHSCVYLAEDLVYTKNGRNQMTPWIISTIDDISRIYLSARLSRHHQGAEHPGGQPTGNRNAEKSFHHARSR